VKSYRTGRYNKQNLLNGIDGCGATVALRSSQHEWIGSVYALQTNLCFQCHSLADAAFTEPDHRGVNTGIIAVQANDRFHYFRIALDCVWVEIHHDATLVLHRDADRGAIVSFPEQQCAAHPIVFQKRLSAFCFEHDVRSEPAKVDGATGFTHDALHCGLADYGDAGFVENTVFEIHQLEVAAVAYRNFFAQFVASEFVFFSVGRTHMSGERFGGVAVEAEGFVEEKLRQLTSGQPWEGTFVGEAAKSESAIGFQAMPG
jgi:hypothetical protein